MGIVIRQSIKGTLVNYVGAFIGCVTTLFVVTKFLPPEDVGLRSVIYEAALLVATLAQLGTTSSIMRYFPYFKDKAKGHNGFFFYIIMLPLVGCAVFIPLYLLLRQPIVAFFSENSPLFTGYFYWLIPLIVFLAYWGVFETYSNANMRIAVPKFIREVVVRLLLIAVYVVYGLHLVGRDGFVASYIAVYGVAMLLTLLYVSRIAPVTLRHDSSFIGRPLRKDMANYTLVWVVGALGSTILGKLDLFMVSSDLGFGAAGVYTIAFYIGTVIEIPARSITPMSAAIVAEAMRRGDLAEAKRLHRKVSLTEFVISSFLFVLMWVNIDNIFSIMPNGEVYRAGKWVVFFIGLSKVVIALLQFGSTLIGFSRYYHWTLYFVFILTGLGIVSNWLFIPLWGISGAAIATLVTCCVSLAFQQWIVMRKIRSNPFSAGTLKMAVVIGLLFGLDALLPVLDNCWLDCAYRTAIIGLTGCALIYFGKVSEDVNGLLDAMVEKVRGKK